MTNRAQALSDAIHAKLFPQSSRIIRHQESRRIITELVAEHMPELNGARAVKPIIAYLGKYPNGSTFLTWPHETAVTYARNNPSEYELMPLVERD